MRDLEKASMKEGQFLRLIGTTILLSDKRIHCNVHNSFPSWTDVLGSICRVPIPFPPFGSTAIDRIWHLVIRIVSRARDARVFPTPKPLENGWPTLFIVSIWWLHDHFSLGSLSRRGSQGNDFIPTYPCNYEAALCVAATTPTEELADYSVAAGGKKTKQNGRKGGGWCQNCQNPFVILNVVTT